MHPVVERERLRARLTVRNGLYPHSDRRVRKIAIWKVEQEAGMYETQLQKFLTGQRNGDDELVRRADRAIDRLIELAEREGAE